MKNYFKSTVVVLAVVALLVQACGDNNKNSTSVAAAGPRGGADTTPGLIESKAIIPTDSKINFTILKDNIDVVIDGDQKFLAAPDKKADGSDSGTTTVSATVNLLIKNIKVPINLTHNFITKLTDLATKARDAGNNANAKVAAQNAAQKKADDAKTANDVAQALLNNPTTNTPNNQNAAADAKAALGAANTVIDAAKAAADDAKKAAIAAADAATKDAETKALLEKNAIATHNLIKLNPINGLDYNIEVVGFIPSELSSMYYVTVRMAAINKDQVKNSARAFALAFGVPANQSAKTVKLVLEDASLLSTSIVDAEKTLEGVFFNSSLQPGLISISSSSSGDQTAKPAADAAAPAKDQTATAPTASAPVAADPVMAAASSVPATKR